MKIIRADFATLVIITIMTFILGILTGSSICWIAFAFNVCMIIIALIVAAVKSENENKTRENYIRNVQEKEARDAKNILLQREMKKIEILGAENYAEYSAHRRILLDEYDTIIKKGKIKKSEFDALVVRMRFFLDEDVCLMYVSNLLSSVEIIDDEENNKKS